MPTYKLNYFQARGFAETARMLFALADVEYEDIRFTREEWPEIRPTTPFNQAPFLEVDGVKISQTTAIYRYLARQFGFAGSSAIDEARGDMIVECIKDMVQPLSKIRYELEDDKKPAFIKKLTEETLPPQLEKLNAFIRDGKFVGDKISWVDVVFFNMFPFFKHTGIDIPYDKYPNLKAVSDNVEADPRIAAWIKKRPVTEM